MNRNGSPNITNIGINTRFRRGDSAAVEAQKKSVEVQKRKYSIRKTIGILSDTPLQKGRPFDIEKIKNLEQVLSADGESNKNLTVSDQIALNIVHGALKDDPECRRLYLELSGAIGDGAEKLGNDEDKVTIVIDVADGGKT